MKEIGLLAAWYKGMAALAAVTLVACVTDDKVLGEAAAGASSDTGGQLGSAGNGGAASSARCDPTSPETSTVSLAAAEIVAAGTDSESGKTYVLIEHGSSLRLFVSGDSEELEEQFETGAGQGTDGSTRFWTFQYEDDQGTTTTVEVDSDAAGTRMGLATGPISGKRFNVGSEGIFLSEVDPDAAAVMPAQSTQTFHLEYVGAASDGRNLVVVAPDHASSFDGFRVFLGPVSALQEETVTNVSRGLSTPSATIINLTIGGMPASLNYSGTDAALANADGETDFVGPVTPSVPSGSTFECI